MRKILSLLLVPLFSLVIFLTSYSPAFAACTITSFPARIAPNSSFDVSVTGTPGAIITITIETRSGTDTGISNGGIITDPSGFAVSLPSPPSVGDFTLKAKELIDGEYILCNAQFFEVCAECSTISDPNAPAELGSIVLVIRNIIKLLVPVAAIAFFIMMIIGGAQFIFSGGDPKAAAGARSTLTYAIIGIILVIVSWLILLLVQNVTGVDVTSVVFPTF